MINAGGYEKKQKLTIVSENINYCTIIKNKGTF